jgi:hypothetical protein
LRNLLERKPLSYQFKDILDWDSSASDTRFAEVNIGIDGYSLFHLHLANTSQSADNQQIIEIVSAGSQFAQK